MKIKKLFVLSLLLSAGIFLKGSSAFAATKTWNGATDNNFSTSTNWTPSGAPTTGDDLVFDNATAVTHGSPDNDMVGLSVASITFTGTGLGGVHDVNLANKLIVTSLIQQDSTSNNVDSINGKIQLGGDVTVKSVSFDDSTPSTTGTIDLNGHMLTFLDSAINTYIVSLNIPIIGTGSVVYNAPNSDIQLHAANTYAGDTTYQAGNLLTVGIPATNIFGTSSVAIFSGASLTISLSNADNGTTISNPISIGAYDSSLWTSGWNSLFFGGSPSSAITVNVPNITLQGNTRIGVNDNITVNFAGMTANSHCIEYVLLSKTTSFAQNGAPACVLADTTTKVVAPKTPNTGFGLIMNNPVAVLAGTAVAAFGIYFVSRRVSRKTR